MLSVVSQMIKFGTIGVVVMSIPPKSPLSPLFHVTRRLPQPVTGCSLGYVEQGGTLVGFDVDDVCVEDTVE